MKLLFYRYNNICEPDLLETFREFGFHITEYSEEIERKDVKPSETVRAVSELLQKEPVDFVFSVNFYPALSEVCNLFHIRYISWTVDSPVPELFTSSIRNEWNRTFIFDKADYEELKDKNPGKIFHLPLAVRTKPKEELFRNADHRDTERFTQEISFVGSLYSEKNRYDGIKDLLSDETRGYLEGIMRAQELVYGYYYIEEILPERIISEVKERVPDFFSFGTDSLFTDRMSLSRYYISYGISAMERTDTFRKLGKSFPGRTALYTGSDTSGLEGIKDMGRVKTLTEMPLVFRNSAVNLNITAKGIRSGLPLRIFDILSAGGFVLTNYQSELPELFSAGEELAVYVSFDELADLCAYYLSHEEEREGIALCGYEAVKTRYTYEIQVGKMMEKAFL